MEKAQPLTKSKLLLVEGKDEQNLFTALVSHLSLADFQIIAAGGYTQFQSRLKAVMITPGWENVQTLAIIRDADNDAAAAFQSIRSVLQRCGLPSPQRPEALLSDTPSVSVLIVPPHAATGMLEDVCLESVQDDPAMPCVTDYLNCLRNSGIEQPANMAKASVRAFLASQEWLEVALYEQLQAQFASVSPQFSQQVNPASAHAFLASRYKPDMDVGVAAQKGYWNFEHDAFASIRQFLRSL